MLDKNTGVIILPPSDTDFIVGAENQLEFEDRNAKWDLYRPSKEKQYFKYFDSMSCVSFSHCNVVETQLNWMLQTGQLNDIKEKLVDFIEDGLFNFSDRFLAKMSGTTRTGNSLQKVADTARHFGFVPEKAWSWNDDFDWDGYMAPIPDEVKEMGKLFLKYFEISYEWVGTAPSVIKHQLKHAPLQIATSTCPGWNAGEVIQACQKPVSHAYMLDGYTDSTWEVFDHYEPYDKQLAPDFVIPWVMKIVVSRPSAVTRNYDLVFDGFTQPGTNKAWFDYQKGIYKNDIYVEHVLGRKPTEDELTAMSYGRYTPDEVVEDQKWKKITHSEFRAKILQAKLK